MRTWTRTVTTAIAVTGLTLAMAACSSSGNGISGSATGETPPTVTEIVTETESPTSTPAETTTTEPSEEPTEETETSLPEATETDTPVASTTVDEPELDEPTNPPPASDACTTADLDISLTIDGGAAGSVIYDLIFTNSGTDTCSLQGFPEVSYVRGDKGIQVGAPATRDGKVGKAVSLAPGDRATAMLQQVDVYNFDASDCDPVKVRGLRVYPPGQDAAAFVPQKGAVGCKAENLPGGQFQMSVQSIAAG